MFEIFTAAAKQALVTAQDEAIALGYDCVAAEHLLIGLAAPDDEPGAVAYREYAHSPLDPDQRGSGVANINNSPKLRSSNLNNDLAS